MSLSLLTYCSSLLLQMWYHGKFGNPLDRRKPLRNPFKNNKNYKIKGPHTLTRRNSFHGIVRDEILVSLYTHSRPLSMSGNSRFRRSLCWRGTERSQQTLWLRCLSYICQSHHNGQHNHYIRSRVVSKHRGTFCIPKLIFHGRCEAALMK